MSNSEQYLIVGLGNPGVKYEWTRHNIGALLLQTWAKDLSLNWKSKFKGQTASTTHDGSTLVFLFPETFMNLSGESVRPCADFYKISPQNILVVHDEIDFGFGRLAFKQGGGHGGHNGLKSIEQHLGTRDFLRLRMGVGRPLHGDVSAWVLSQFCQDDMPVVADMVDLGIQAAKHMIAHGLTQAAQKFNRSVIE